MKKLRLPTGRKAWTLLWKIALTVSIGIVVGCYLTINSVTQPASVSGGVEPERAPTLTRALEAGRPVDAEAGGIAADSLAPNRVGELVFPIARRHVSATVLVSDEAIRDAQKLLWKTLRVVAEPGGAAAFAALSSQRYVPHPQERVGVLICGGNTVAVDFDR